MTIQKAKEQCRERRKVEYKLGDKKCEDMELCAECPLNCLICHITADTLYETLDCCKEKYNMPNLVYKAFKKQLDKEVEE